MNTISSPDLGRIRRRKGYKKPLEIKYVANGDYLKIHLNSREKYKVSYPKKYLSVLSAEDKNKLLKNFVYCKTCPLRITHKRLSYKFEKPFMEDFIERSVVSDIPRISHMSKINGKLIEDSFYSNKSKFLDTITGDALSLREKSLEDRFLLSLSFGKDSLFTYALLKELGVNFSLVSFNVGIKNEKKVKTKIISKFLKNEKQTLVLINDNTDKLIVNHTDKKNTFFLDYTNGLLSFTLELIPVAINSGCRYIVFGNQKDFDNYYIDNNTHKRVYYSSDQSSPYMHSENKFLHDFTNNNIKVTSLIKPIYDISTYKILSTRYKRLIPYILSCEDSPSKAWCGNCEICAFSYLLISAFADPKMLKFRKDTFGQENLKDYFLFARNRSVYQNVYSKSFRDQELLGFLLAIRNGQNGYLMELFKKRYLKEAERREAELRKKFFKVYKSDLVPSFLRKNLYDLLEKELSPLR